MYRASWTEDQRVDTPETLGPWLEAAGEPAAELLAPAVEPDNLLASMLDDATAR